MLKILWKRGKIAPEEQFLPLSTIFYYLMLDFYVITGIRFSFRDKRLFEITEVEITRLDCILLSGNTEPTCISLSGHFMDIEGRVLVHQTERYQLSLSYNASWLQRAVASTDFCTTFFQY